MKKKNLSATAAMAACHRRADLQSISTYLRIILSLITLLLVQSTLTFPGRAGAQEHRVSAVADTPLSSEDWSFYLELQELESKSFFSRHRRDLRHRLDITPEIRRGGQSTAFDSTHSYDVLYYKLDLVFPMVSNYFSGVATVTCKSMEQNLRTIDLHAVGLTIHQVKRDGRPVHYSVDTAKLYVDLDTTFAPNDTFAVEISYSGSPDHIGYYFYQRNAYTVTEPQDSRYWFPCFDEPWDKANGCEISMTVPQGYLAASNGLLVKATTNQDGTITYTWREDYPITTYLMCVTMGQFATFSDWYINEQGDSIEVKNYVFPEDTAKARVDFENVVEMIDFFSDRFGPYPFDKYGQAAVEPFPYGGMEHQDMTTMNRRWIRGDKSREGGICHELAHMWWGDMVTLADWRHIWLNEGFATYSNALWNEYKYGEERFRNDMRGMANWVIYKDTTDRRYPIFDPPPGYLFGTNEYQKGACVLHMLRYLVGEDDFWRILKTYASRYAYGNASTEEFRQVCEEVSGQNLAWFFDQWIYQAGYPEYQYSWTWEEETGTYYMILYINQVQTNAPIFRMPIELAIHTEVGVTDTTVWVEKAAETFYFTLSSLPLEVKLDPNDWILKIVHPQPLPVGPPKDFVLWQNFPNPFNIKTTILYELPVPSRVELKIYNLQGQVVKTLVDKSVNRGRHLTYWDGTDSRGRKVASGVYFCVMKAGGVIDKKKTLFLK